MDSRCAAFWKHTNIRSNNKIFPCCRFKSPVADFDGNLIEILDSEVYKELRDKSARGEFIKGCEKCYYEESKGKTSLRQKLNEEYDTDSVQLEFLEIGFDNICNLTCDGCWSDFSSAWSKKLNPKSDKIIHYKSIDEIHQISSTIKKILFLGGEPLMTNRHAKFLNLVTNPTAVEVIYNTNGTFLLDENLISILNKFKSVKFILSLDGYADLNDRVRSGSKWSDILNFIDQIKQLNFILEINSVLHLNSWAGIKDLEKFIKELDVVWTVNVLTYPFHLDIVNYHDRKEIINLIKETGIPNKEYVIRHLS